MGGTDSTAIATPPFGTQPGSAAFVGPLHEATLELFAAADPSEIAGHLLSVAGRVVPVDGTSLWVPAGDRLECRGATGENGGLTGSQVEPSEVGATLGGESGMSVFAAGVSVDGRLTVVLRVTRTASRDGPFSDVEKQVLRHLADAAGAAMANATRLASSERAATERGRDLALITEMSREITATLDLDRVLRSVVNLASRAIEFDRGAIGLYDKGACDIRAVAGADTIDSKEAGIQDLAVRAAWAAGHGEAFYLSDRSDPGSDAERMFVQVFGGDLERDGVASSLYLPLKDEEGIVGILLFEAARTDFTTERERELATILANQATVAIRNARLYHQVPLADTLGAIAAKRQAFLRLPKQRRIALAAILLASIATVTLIRWPLRVPGSDPVFRPLWRTDVRPTLSGVIDRVFVREGMQVDRGAPVAHLRDDELRAQRDAAAAAVVAAERSASVASARSDAAEERLHRLRAGVLRRETDLLDEQLRSTMVRSPVGGIVLTARPEERVGTHASAGDLLAVVGRTDSLELEFGVDQHDVTRVTVGDEVRLRVDALPQRTFIGRVTSVAPLGFATDGGVKFPVRAVLANPDGLLRPGMAAYARVLTAPASVLGRLSRAPLRALRLMWWRMWS